MNTKELDCPLEPIQHPVENSVPILHSSIPDYIRKKHCQWAFQIKAKLLANFLLIGLFGRPVSFNHLLASNATIHKIQNGLSLLLI